jgi:hypothetical protein
MCNIDMPWLATLNRMEKSYERLLKAAKELKRWGTPAEVARKLGISDQTIQNWKTRGVPQGKLTLIEDKIGVSGRWIAAGQGEMRIQAKIPGQAELTDDQKRAITLAGEIGDEGRNVWLQMGDILAKLTLDGGRRHEDLGNKPERRGRRIGHTGHHIDNSSIDKKSKRDLNKEDEQ